MSDGICPFVAPSSLTTWSDRLRDQRVGELEVGRTLVGARRGGGVVARARGRRPRMEVLRRGERLPDERAADHLPVHA